MPRLPGSGLIRGLRRRFRGPDRREPGLVNHVALGNHCQMAQILKAAGLRGWSGPFDWIFSSPGMIRDCLADDFAGLLDRSHYRSTPPELRPAPDVSRCRHDLYADRYAIPFVFNHHDPATNEGDRLFLREGVRRLRSALDRPEADNRFYALVTRPTPDEDILGLAEGLVARGRHNRLFALQTAPGLAPGAITPVTHPNANLTWLRIGTRSESGGLRFVDPADDALVRDLVLRLAASP